MRSFIGVLTLVLMFINGSAQPAEDSVRQVINDLFAGMKNADSSLVRRCLHDSIILQTVVSDRQGRTSVVNEGSREFIAFIGTLEKDIADERVRFETIRIDGPLAFVWAPYEFYYKGKFSHCGVDAFVLVRQQQGWKIQYLVDTRRKTGCR